MIVVVVKLFLIAEEIGYKYRRVEVFLNVLKLCICLVEEENAVLEKLLAALTVAR